MNIPDTRILRLPEVKARTGLGATSVYRGIKQGWFPRPVKLVGNTVGWRAEEIDAWIKQRNPRTPAA